MKKVTTLIVTVFAALSIAAQKEKVFQSINKNLRFFSIILSLNNKNLM